MRLVDALHRHSCTNADHRCKKHVDKNTGEFKCRVPKQVGHFEATLCQVKLDKVFDSEAVDIIKELPGQEYFRHNIDGELEMNPKRAG